MGKQKDEGQRERNRREFPQAAALLDEFRAEFGAGVKLACAEENGRTIGRKVPPPGRFVTAGQWLDASERLVKPELARRKVTPELLLDGRARKRGRS